MATYVMSIKEGNGLVFKTNNATSLEEATNYFARLKQMPVKDFKKFGKATDKDIQTILTSGQSGQIPYVMSERGMSYSEVLYTLKKGKPLIEGIDKIKKADGGRAEYFGGGLINLIKAASKVSPLQAYKNYIKSVKTKAQKGDMKSLAPELGAVAGGGIFVNRRMSDILENMKNQDMEIL